MKSAAYKKPVYSVLTPGTQVRILDAVHYAIGTVVRVDAHLYVVSYEGRELMCRRDQLREVQS